MFHWVEVVNYLINCLLITTRRTPGNNIGFWSIARIHSTGRCNIYGFKYGNRNGLSQGRGLVVYITMELDFQAEMIVYGSNCIVKHFTGKECYVGPYTDE